MDLLEILDLIERPLQAPNSFTQELFTLDEFRRAREAWVKENGNFNSAFLCHLWDPRTLSSSQAEASGHSFDPMRAWLGCSHDPRPGTPAAKGNPDRCSCVGGTLVRGVCTPCGWATPIVTDEAAAVALWHDHAWPGWRDLPVVATRQPHDEDRRGKAATRWIEQVEALYPLRWHRPGAPVVTARQTYGERGVPGRSPWGGFDLAPVHQQLPTAH